MGVGEKKHPQRALLNPFSTASGQGEAAQRTTFAFVNLLVQKPA
jgi:hypothetical protein